MKALENKDISLNIPTDHPECERTTCILRTAELSGKVGCLMDSVKSFWSNPTAENYCNDPSCKKFVDRIHAKTTMKPIPRSL
jgi:hypothetical protein